MDSVFLINTNQAERWTTCRVLTHVASAVANCCCRCSTATRPAGCCAAASDLMRACDDWQGYVLPTTGRATSFRCALSTTTAANTSGQCTHGVHLSGLLGTAFTKDGCWNSGALFSPLLLTMLVI